MLKNNICMNCDKQTVCNWWNVIKKFDADVAKNPIATEIEIKQCPEYKEA